MGHKAIRQARSDREVRAFTRAVLRDVEALERMLDEGTIEHGVRRMGVEQEIFLVTPNGRPAPVAPRVLEAVGEPRFTTELALFNLEVNLAPQPLGGEFLRTLEEDLVGVVATLREVAEPLGATPLLAGILPTLRRADLGLHNMTPEPRYAELNRALLALRGDSFSIFIRGVDELEVKAESVMLESANTSLQLHLQASPEALPHLHNLAQALSAPLIAAAANSPLLFGRRLWQETRVALFERSVDGRSSAEVSRGHHPRVCFGRSWLEGSAVEVFRENSTRFRVVLTRDVPEDPIAVLARGEPPALAALALHNSTVWRWNRVCYGVGDGRPHLRIENRVLPAGPTVLDEVANAALFYGLMTGLAEPYAGLESRLAFDDARGNFIAAARHGLDAHFDWLDGRRVAARELLLEELLPCAREGLSALGAPEDDVERYLGTVEERLETRQTGARWLLESFSNMASTGEATPYGAATTVVEAMVRHQQSGEPVHRWEPVRSEGALASSRFRTVGDIMSADLFTVRPEDVVDLATRLMRWRHFRHVPVENEAGQLVGLVSHRALLQLGDQAGAGEPVAVEEIMDRDPPTVDPDTPLHEAMRRLLETGAGCLLVVSGGRLVGIATERDFVRAAAALLGEVGQIEAIGEVGAPAAGPAG